MSSISGNGGTDREAQTRDCPACGDDLQYNGVRERKTVWKTTLSEEWWCSSCQQRIIACEHCESLHQLGDICAPKRGARFKIAKEIYGAKAKIPGEGIVPISECEAIDGVDPAYVADDGCPEDECDGDLIHSLVQACTFTRGLQSEAEYLASYEVCSEFEEGDNGCSHREP
jgi:hypothetical protein